MIVPYCEVCRAKVERKSCERYHENNLYLRGAIRHVPIEIYEYGLLTFYCDRCVDAAIDIVVDLDEGSTLVMLKRMKNLAERERRERLPEGAPQ